MYGIREFIASTFNRRHLLIATLISFSMLMNIALFSPRITSSTDISILGQFPLLFWFFLVLTSILIPMTVHVFRNWKASLLMSVLFFVMFYSFGLMFHIIPNQSDIGATGFYMWYFENNDYLDVARNSYFEFPLYFVFGNLIMRSLDLGAEQTINLGFFLVLFVYPFALTTLLHRGLSKEMNFIVFLFPSIYLVSIFFYFNDQFVPQFLGLLFLIAAVGTYTQLKTSGDVRFFYLTVLFYTACVFTHYFMFIFFILGLMFHKLYVFLTGGTHIRRFSFEMEGTIGDFLKQLLRKGPDIVNGIRRTVTSKVRDITLKLTGRSEKRDISLTVLILIFLVGYLWRFHSITTEIQRALSPSGGKGGSWVLVSYILGSKSAAGISQIRIQQHYEMISRNTYLISRYSIFLVLLLIVIALVIALLKARKERILPFDIHFILGSMVFLISGFFNPQVLGERSTQTLFLTTSKYHSSGTRIFDRALPLLTLAIIASPTLFSVNLAINETIDGNMFVEDSSSLQSGYFINEYRPANITIMTPDRRFYPVMLPRSYNETGYRFLTPYALLLQDEYTIEDADLIIHNPKFQNRMEYFSLEDKLQVYANCSSIYDQGTGRLYLLP